MTFVELYYLLLPLYPIFVILCWAYITWFFFLALMTLKAAHDAGRVSKGIVLLAAPIVIFGVAADFIFNVLASFIFIEHPKEWLFTARVERHMHEQTWRGGFSRWCCRNLLDPFQLGGHCGS